MAFVSQPTQEGPTSLSSSSSSIASEQAVLMQKSLTSLGHILTPLIEKRAATVLVEDYVFLFYSIYSKVFNKASVWDNLYERRCTEPMSSQFLRNLGLKMGIEHLWSYFDVLPCGDIVVWAVDQGRSRHHHLITSSSSPSRRYPHIRWWQYVICGRERGSKLCGIQISRRHPYPTCHFVIEEAEKRH